MIMTALFLNFDLPEVAGFLIQVAAFMLRLILLEGIPIGIKLSLRRPA
jgi:hypothetical protein